METLGKFPLPVEVIPMARAHVERELAALGGTPRLRAGFTTDNGNLILDVHGLSIADPAALEDAHQPHHRRGDQWPVRAAPRRRACCWRRPTGVRTITRCCNMAVTFAC